MATYLGFIFETKNTNVRTALMRLFSIVLLLSFAPSLVAADTPVEIEFEHTPPWHDATLVYMTRLPDGRIHCEVLTRPQTGSERAELKWKRVSEVKVSPDTFERLEREFETSALKLAAERDWSAMPDSARWRLKKKKGSLVVEIVAHNPDVKIEGAAIVKLAHAISAASSAGLFANSK